MLHRYRALAARESIRVFRAKLPPAADAGPEALPQREALDSVLRDFDIGSFVGLAPDALALVLPETILEAKHHRQPAEWAKWAEHHWQPAEWASHRPAGPFPEVLRGVSSRNHCTIVVKTLTGNLWKWHLEEAEAAALRPGESIWARIHVWEVERLLLDIDAHDTSQLVVLFEFAGTVRTLSHPFLSLEAYGAHGAEILLHVKFRDLQLPQLDWSTYTNLFARFDTITLAGITRNGESWPAPSSTPGQPPD
jgi:hypothetical protein